MLSQPINVSFDSGGGGEITIETGKLARQADGSVTVRQGNCILLATVVANHEAREGQDFFRSLLITRKNLHLQGEFRDLSLKERRG